MTKINKTELIYNYLKQGNSLTQLDAYEKFGTTRLSAIIYNLRHTYDADIISETIIAKDRFGNDCFIARYKLNAA